MTVIDTVTLKVAAQISTGAGHHETVISNDNRLAFVSNQESGTLSVIDVQKLAKIKDVEIAYSSFNGAFAAKQSDLRRQ